MSNRFQHNRAIDIVNIYVLVTDDQDQTSLCPQTDLHHLKLALEYLLLVVCLYCKEKAESVFGGRKGNESK